MKRLLLLLILSAVAVPSAMAEKKSSVIPRKIVLASSGAFYSSVYSTGSIDKIIFYEDGTCETEWSGRDGSFTMKLSGTYRQSESVRYLSLSGLAYFPGESPFKVELTGTYLLKKHSGMYICFFDSPDHPCHHGMIYDGDKHRTALLEAICEGKELPDWYWDDLLKKSREGKQ